MRTNRIYEIRLIVAGSRTFHDYKFPATQRELTRLASGTPWNENCHSADSQRSGINMGKWQDQCVMPR